MIKVYVNGISEERRALVSHANAHQSLFTFTGEPGAEFEVVLTSVQHPNFFHLVNHDKVFISTWNVDGICLYAQYRELDFYLLASLLGLTQLRAMKSCTLIPEDFLHFEPKQCLLAQHEARFQSAVKLVEPYICPGCVAFYKSLGVEPELNAVFEVLDRLASRAQTSSRD